MIIKRNIFSQKLTFNENLIGVKNVRRGRKAHKGGEVHTLWDPRIFFLSSTNERIGEEIQIVHETYR